MAEEIRSRLRSTEHKGLFLKQAMKNTKRVAWPQWSEQLKADFDVCEEI